MIPGFWGHNFGWFLWIGFMIFTLSVVTVWLYFDSPSHERRQLHKYRMRELKLRLRAARSGIDPDYVKMLEEKLK